MSDYIPPNRRLYLTPNAPPQGRFCRRLLIPDDPYWVGLVDGALSVLAEEGSWRQYGDMTPEDTALEFLNILSEAWAADDCGVSITSIPTPFWDDVTDTDDEAEPENQVWYGYVDDPQLPPDELTFIENAAIWAFTGLLALSGTPAAAVVFNTVAPSFVLAMRGDDFAEVIRVIVDGIDMVMEQTSGNPDELLQIPIFPDPAIEVHELMIIGYPA